MNYYDTLNYLHNLDKLGINLGLDRIGYLLKRLNNPEAKQKIIHVAGTNGKGSVCSMLGSILKESGYKVGIYTSPQLTDFKERITVNGEKIKEYEVVENIENIKSVIDKNDIIQSIGHPTFFEIVTACALLHFRKHNCDIVILEVGMGGRLDATNIVTPLLSIITNISLEHTDHLGKTIEDIASEKAGIVKDNIPVITNTQGTAFKMIENISKKRNSFVIRANSQSKLLSSNTTGQEIHYKDMQIDLPLLGNFQLENLDTVLEAVAFLNDNGYKLENDSVKRGIENVKWPGRLEIVSSDPDIILDCAHNHAGIKCLKESVKALFPLKKFTLVISISNDKDIRLILNEISEITSNLIITRYNDFNRSADPEYIKSVAKENFKNIIIKPDVRDAIVHAKSIVKDDEIILVTGSIFLIGDAKKILGSI